MVTHDDKLRIIRKRLVLLRDYGHELSIDDVRNMITLIDEILRDE